MDRRKFLRRAGTLGLPLLAGVPGVRAAGSSLFSALLPPDSDRVLVLVQLAGGNDGLNTLIPVDQLGALQSVRNNVYLPENSLLPLTNSLSLHGNLRGLHGLFNDGLVSIVQSVGYPNQNRSHFRSTDIWTTASDATTELDTGWLGRHLEVEYQNYPQGYPNTEYPDPPAISMGSVANATCQGMVTNLSQTVENPFDLTYLAPGGNTPLPNDNYGDELGFLRVAIEQTNEYGLRIQDAARNGSTFANYPDSRLGRQLRHVVRLISGGLQTKVYVVSMGGYDTHSGQTAGDNTTGQHANLLQDLGDCLAAFQDDLEQTSLSDRVMGMTFSEFGRRIRSNGSRGTDHGTAAPLFVFGSCVSGTILGDNPTIDTQVSQYEGVPMQYDFRDLYGSILKDWFGVEESAIRSLLYPGFVYLPIANGCAAALPVDLMNFTATGGEKQIDLSWQTTREEDNAGFEVERSQDGESFTRIGWVPAVAAGSGGIRDYALTDENVRKGPLYYYRLRQQDQDGTFQYSPIRTARLSGAALGQWSFGQVYPNPVIDETTVQVYAPTDGRVGYTLYNNAGQRILSNSQIVYGRRDNQITIRLGQRLPAGAYTLRLSAGEGNYTNRRLIVR
ncbi:MAG: DUF1501 domain-containing protein [Bacteroidota bacterium]